MCTGETFGEEVPCPKGTLCAQPQPVAVAEEGCEQGTDGQAPPGAVQEGRKDQLSSKQLLRSGSECSEHLCSHCSY